MWLVIVLIAVGVMGVAAVIVLGIREDGQRSDDDTMPIVPHGERPTSAPPSRPDPDRTEEMPRVDSDTGVVHDEPTMLRIAMNERERGVRGRHRTAGFGWFETKGDRLSGSAGDSPLGGREDGRS